MMWAMVGADLGSKLVNALNDVRLGRSKSLPDWYRERAETLDAGEVGKSVEFNGKTITQNNELFDPNAVDTKGRTNIQRMEKGLAPIGRDGQSVNIHHIDQTNTSPLEEILESTHQQNNSVLHQNTGQSPSLIDRNPFNKWRNDYWKWRSTDFK